MKTMQSTMLFTSMVFSAAIPSVLFSGEVEGLPVTQELMIKNELQKVFFEAANEYDLETVAQLLVDEVEIGDSNKDGYAPLQLNTFMSNNSEIIGLLIKLGGSVNNLNKSGFRPLQFAALCHYTEIMEMLIENNADIDARGPRGRALTCAVSSSHEKGIDLLLKHKANVNYVDENGISLLGHAIFLRSLCMYKSADAGKRIIALLSEYYD